MAKNIFFIVIILIVAWLIYHYFFQLTPPNSLIIKIKDQDYSFEIAKTMAQKSQGLMNRKELCSNCGMIFVSSNESPQIFWMKNTLIPLDMIFLDKSGKVINIENAVPQPGIGDFNLKLYRSTSPAQYVIELNSGDAKKLNLIPGDQIKLPQF